MVQLLFLNMGIMILIAILQIPPLLKNKQWPELAGFGAIWVFATVYIALLSAGVPIANPTEILRPLLQGFYRWIGLDIEL
ncbi:MAG: hypothetical protein AB1767_13500 [Bacillota bacterium]